MADCQLDLPCTQTAQSFDPLLNIINTESATALQGTVLDNGTGVVGAAGNATVTSVGTGVQGSAQKGNGVLGTSVDAVGVVGAGGQAGVEGDSRNGTGVRAQSAFGSAGRFTVTLDPSVDIRNNNAAVHVSTDAQGPAIETVSTGIDVAGFFHIDNQASSSLAVACSAPIGEGLLATSGQRSGVFSFGNPGVTAVPNGGKAGVFGGDVEVTGNLDAASKRFVIDHPLDPRNRNLVHASVESSEQNNVYTGNVTLDEGGEATVQLPEWMEVLNHDFRYQLTCIGGFASVYVAEEVSGSRFRIAGGKSGIKVSWQLTGLRKDPWAQAHPLVVEEEKPANEKGHYRHPELFGEGLEAGTLWARNPELMQRVHQFNKDHG
jgi:hypothetical protein